ncbi:MAG: hypothetical protein GF364_00165, partial [Candidatus Lokiarchaeota archaeon]|nr:hypothetical protein [Candidatus Lokiarchaeota archaeon]
MELNSQLQTEFLDYAQTIDNPYIKDWLKKGGKGVIGYYCSNLPEELIHAAGFLPFRIRGTTNKDYLMSDAILSRFNCTFVRSTLNLALNHVYDFLDGLLVANTCDHIRRMYGIFKKKVEKAKNGDMKVFFLSLPHRYSKDAWQWTRDELDAFRNTLNTTYNIEIRDEDIHNALNLYKENTDLMRELYDFRMLDNPKLSGVDFIKISLANMSVRKEYAN